MNPELRQAIDMLCNGAEDIADIIENEHPQLAVLLRARSRVVRYSPDLSACERVEELERQLKEGREG